MVLNCIEGALYKTRKCNDTLRSPSYPLRGMIKMVLTDETFGIRITHYRKERQLTQANLATITGIRPKHLSDIERGRNVRIYTLARLAMGLGGKCSLNHSLTH